MSEAAASEPRPEAGKVPGLRPPARLLSEERLARRACRGDRGALEEIYRRYHQELYRFCLAMTGGRPQDAQDALQNAMVKVLRALPGERRPIQLRPWLYRIARNEAVETIRRRREGSELEPDSAGGTPPLAETAEARQRLRALIADLAELPESQRAALTLRELSGLGFEQIGASFGTSAAVARQTVYEARQSLRQMEAGREMSCDAVRREISDADGRVTRRREIRAHLRDCGDCRAFREAIAERRQDLGAIAPLPIVLSAGLLQGALGAAGASVNAGAAGAGGIGGAVSAAAGSTLAKSVATVAVAGALGVTAADRSGLVDAPVLGGGSESASSPARSSGSESSADRASAGHAGAVGDGSRGSGRASAGKAGRRGGGSAASRRGEGAGGANGKGAGARQGAGARGAPGAGHTGGGRHGGYAGERPPAAAKVHGAAGPRKPPQANRSPEPGAQAGGGNSQPARPAPPPRSDPEPPATAAPPPVPAPADEPSLPVEPQPEPAPQAAPEASGTSVQPQP